MKSASYPTSPSSTAGSKGKARAGGRLYRASLQHFPFQGSSRRHPLKYLLLGCDFLVVAAAFLAARWLVGRLLPLPLLSPWLLLVPVIPVLYVFYETRQYKLDQLRRPGRELRSALLGYLFGALFLGPAVWLVPGMPPEAAAVFSGVFVAGGVVFTLGMRLLILGLWSVGGLDWLICSEVALALGTGRLGHQFAAHHPGRNLGIRLAGYLSESSNGKVLEVLGIPVVGTLADLPEVARRLRARQLFIALDEIDYNDLMVLIDRIGELGLVAGVVGDPFSAVNEYLEGSELQGVPLVSLRYRTPGLFQMAVKRAFDIVFSAVALTVLFPFFLLIGVLIKLTSDGDVFFLNPVVGQHGRPFKMIKFRTMRADNSNSDHEAWTRSLVERGDVPYRKLENDDRITAVGRFLRKFSLDELPQLINVLRGEMSLIGPRPAVQYEYREYQPWHRRRTLVRPGITGLHQVSGRGQSTFNDMIALDLYYIHNYSFLQDIRIFFATIPVILLGRGGA